MLTPEGLFPTQIIPAWQACPPGPGSRGTALATAAPHRCHHSQTGPAQLSLWGLQFHFEIVLVCLVFSCLVVLSESSDSCVLPVLENPWPPLHCPLQSAGLSGGSQGRTHALDHSVWDEMQAVTHRGRVVGEPGRGILAGDREMGLEDGQAQQGAPGAGGRGAGWEHQPPAVMTSDFCRNVQMASILP